MYNQDLIIAMEVSQYIDDIYACERNIPVVDNPKVKFTRFMMKYNNKNDLSKFKDDPDGGAKYCQDRIRELEELKKGVKHPALKVQLKKYKDGLKSFQSMNEGKRLIDSIGNTLTINLSNGIHHVKISPQDFYECFNSGKPASVVEKDAQFYLANIPKWVKKDEARIIEDAYDDFYPDDDLPDNPKLFPRWLHFDYEDNKPVCSLVCCLVENGEFKFGIKFTKSGWDGNIQ